MSSALLVAAGPSDAVGLTRFYESSDWQCVIAIDGGYEALRNVDIAPTMVVGDFDSLGYVPDAIPADVHSPIKDESDMELALNLVGSFDVEELFIFGALGGRLDHTLANLALFARASEQGYRVLAAGINQALAMITGPDVFHLPKGARGVVSVFSMNDHAIDVTEQGLFYPLEKATLSNRTSLGLSNELIGEAASISVGQGTVAIFYPIELMVPKAST